ncbi:FUSC family protein [Streptomyces sp. PLAI1-29]|uniref:FUSC family protein n=2 Tax=Streptomyces zingiberis TaxID=2053010 RepID=A0ABX1BWZ2_9ACTN|nr:FUSC family protein [Streptomyces zingiberis]
MIQDRLEDSDPDEQTAASVERRVAGMEVSAERLAAVLLDHDRPPHTPSVTARLRELYQAVSRDWLLQRTPVGLGYVRERLLGYCETERLAREPASDQEVLRAIGELVYSALGLEIALGRGDGDADDRPRTSRYREELETEELSRRAERERPEGGGRAVPLSGEGARDGARADAGAPGTDGERGRPGTDGSSDGGGRALGAGKAWSFGRKPKDKNKNKNNDEPKDPKGKEKRKGERERAGETARKDGATPGTDAEEPSDGEPRGLRRPSTRTAFQVTVGSALAIAGGELLSPQRWYWAVLTCWVVFLGTASTGEILVKGYRRLTGTAIGVFAGAGLAGLAGGRPGLAFGIILICVFAAFYVAPVSHTLTSFFMTSMLGLLFTLLDTYSSAVLLLRVEETLIGVACGLIAALLVLPIRTSEHTDGLLRTVLERMRDVTEEAVRRLSGERGGSAPVAGADLLEAARELDDALDGLRAAVKPLTHPISPLRTRSQTARYILALLDGGAYHVRSLAAVAEQVTGGSRISPDPRVASAAGRLSRNLRTLTDSLAEPGERPAEGGVLLPASDTLTLAVIEHPARSPVGARVARHIQRLDEIVIGLAEPLGVPVEGGGTRGRTPSGGKPAPPNGQDDAGGAAA